MKTIAKGGSSQQRAGGVAALYLALAYLAAMPFYLLAVDYMSVTDPVQKVAVLSANQGSMAAMNLVSYVIFGVVLAVLALALYDRLKYGMAATMRAATVVGLIWAVVLIASGLVFNAGMATVAELYRTNPAQAVSAWQAIQPVTEGLGGSGGELLGGLWVLLVSLVAVRTGGLPKPLGWLGLVLGAAGLVSVIPPLHDAAYAFGLLQIVWFIWLGVAMLRPAKRDAEQPAAAPVAAGSAAGELAAGSC